MKPETLTARYASLERLRHAWYRRIAQGKLYVPCSEAIAEGAVIVLQIYTPDTPAPLELEGVVLSIHNVQAEGQLLRGVELTLKLPSFIRTAVEAYLALDWGRAAPVMGDSSKVGPLWTTFGAAAERTAGTQESGALTARRHSGPAPTTNPSIHAPAPPPVETAPAFPREHTVRISSPALALTPLSDEGPPPPPPPTTRRPVPPTATESQENAATIPPGAFIFRKH